MGLLLNSQNIERGAALYRAARLGHEQFDRERKESSFTENVVVTTYMKIVNSLLEAGAAVHETSDFNPATAHLKPTKIMKPNTHILKLLLAAGAEIENELFIVNECLQDLARKSIRKCLKAVHPEKNLFGTIPQLGLPQQMQSHLLYYTKQSIETNIKDYEKEFLLETFDGHVENILSLIKTGVDINVQNDNGMTALMMAAQNGQIGLVEELLKAGANKNLQAHNGDTALICATKEGKKKSVRKLLEFGANVNIQDQDGQTAIMHAVMMSNEDCLQLLIHNGANLNIQDHNGHTALMMSAVKNSDVTNMLIEAGADLNLAGRGGFRAIQHAVLSGNVNCLKKFIQAGANLNVAENVAGTTPLIFAALHGSIDCVKELIQAGADLNFEINKYHTALGMAALKSSFKCAITLFKAGAIVGEYLALIAKLILWFWYVQGIYCFSYLCCCHKNIKSAFTQCNRNTFKNIRNKYFRKQS